MSCGSTKESTETTSNTESTLDSPTEMMLSKGVCYGKCPVFVLEVKEGGLAVLQAKKNVPEKSGVYKKQLGAQAYKELKEAFMGSSFDKFENVYESRIPDLPLIKVGYMVSDSLFITEGKEGRPSELVQLQYRLENIMQSGGWELVEKYDRPAVKAEEERPTYILSEIILLPKAGANLPRLFRKYEQYGFRVLKRITPNQNYWLTTYNQSKIKPEEMLKLLQADEKVDSAEFNKETSNRGER